MPDIDPSNSYGTPEGPETAAAVHVTEPPIDPAGRGQSKPDDDDDDDDDQSEG